MPDNLPPPLPTHPPSPPVIGRAPQPPPLPSPTTRPGIVLFYRWWCALFVVLYLGMSVFETLIALGRMEPPLGLIESAVSYHDKKARDEIIADKRADAPGMAAFTAAIALTYAFAAFVPRKPWAWTFSLVVICTTIFPYVITAAGAIPLIIQWTKPPVRQHFGKRP